MICVKAGFHETYSTGIKAVLSETNRCGGFNPADGQTPTHPAACSPVVRQGKKTGKTGMKKVIDQA